MNLGYPYHRSELPPALIRDKPHKTTRSLNYSRDTQRVMAPSTSAVTAATNRHHAENDLEQNKHMRDMHFIDNKNQNTCSH